MPATPPRRRKAHPASRARNMVAGASAAAFLGLGGVMALATGAAHVKSSSTNSNTSARQAIRQDDGFSSTSYGDDDGFGDSQSFNGFGAQPGFSQSSGSPNLGGGNTATHGS